MGRSCEFRKSSYESSQKRYCSDEDYIHFLEGKRKDLEKILDEVEEDLYRRNQQIDDLEEIIEIKEKKLRKSHDVIEEKQEENRTVIANMNALEEEVSSLRKTAIDENLTCKRCNHEDPTQVDIDVHMKTSHMESNAKRLQCIYNNRGHCKNGNLCFFRHYNEICSKFENCIETNCPKRHPKTCKYGSTCTFGPNCSYRHKAGYSEDNDVEERDVT